MKLDRFVAPVVAAVTLAACPAGETQLERELRECRAQYEAASDNTVDTVDLVLELCQTILELTEDISARRPEAPSLPSCADVEPSDLYGAPCPDEFLTEAGNAIDCTMPLCEPEAKSGTDQ